jgi:hypothetical protein
VGTGFRKKIMLYCSVADLKSSLNRPVFGLEKSHKTLTPQALLCRLPVQKPAFFLSHSVRIMVNDINVRPMLA